MVRVLRCGLLVLAFAGAPLVAGCQSPTDPDDTPDVDDILQVTISPEPAIAETSTDGRTYRVPRNNEPDEIRVFDWKTSFSLVVLLNDQADDEDFVTFPVDLVSTTIKVQQASGGIVTPPTGGEAEHYDFITQASGNRFNGVNTSISIGFDAWYDLPSLRKEALIAVTLSFRDADGVTFSKSVDVRVAP